MMLSAARIAAMERATLDAVPPQQREALGDWLLGIDDGVVSRARSATPLQHGPQMADTVDRVAQRYAHAGQPALFRVPDTAGLRAVSERLAALGYLPASPTLVQCADAAPVLQSVASQPHAEGSVTGSAFKVTLLDTPDEAWCALFLGDGVGAGAGAGAGEAEAASRTRILRRAQHAVYAQVQVEGETVATGMGSYSEGWASVHGMRTRPAHRGQGYAGAIVRALAREALRRQLPQMFLQVEQSNTGAQALYRRLGFEDLWLYRYWAAPAR
ncbi:MAG: GNAT family N-acetyltransferase [Burkholderiaceae bacterium]